MSALRLPYALLAGALLALPLAHAQTTDPTVNESEMDTSTPPADESYLNDTSSDNGTSAPADPSLNDSDFDTSVPADDTSSWLTDSEAAAATPAPAASAAHATPGFEAVAMLGAAVAALALLRRR